MQLDDRLLPVAGATHLHFVPPGLTDAALRANINNSHAPHFLHGVADFRLCGQRMNLERIRILTLGQPRTFFGDEWSPNNFMRLNCNTGGAVHFGTNFRTDDRECG